MQHVPRWLAQAPRPRDTRGALSSHLSRVGSPRATESLVAHQRMSTRQERRNSRVGAPRATSSLSTHQPEERQRSGAGQADVVRSSGWSAHQRGHVRAEVVGPADGVVERPAVFGEVEVLDRQTALVVERRRAVRALRRSRRHRAGRRRGPASDPGFPWRSCTWSACSSSSSGSPPQSATWPVSTSSRRPGTSAWIIASTDSIEFTTRRPTARAAHRATDATSAPPLPHRRRPPCGAGVAHQPGLRLRERRRAPDRQHERRGVDVDEHVDVLEPDRPRARRSRSDSGSRQKTTSTTPRRYRNRSPRYFFVARVLHARGHHHADVLQVLAEDSSKCSATASGVQPPSRHMNAICFGCWKIVYAKSVRPRIWPFTCAGALRREERDERRVERRDPTRAAAPRPTARTATPSSGCRPPAPPRSP